MPSASVLLPSPDPPDLPAPLPPAEPHPANFPPDEASRLAELGRYEIIDTEAEEAFDRFARLAAEILDTPMALISLLDGSRQWFKAAIGVSVRETPRSIAFCDHALRQDAPLIVADALADARFANNPLVLGDPHIRFYAGAQLRTGSGHVLGTLCGLDTRPHIISDKQISQLRDLAAAVMTALELRRLRRELAAVANTDPLTGLANRARLVAELERQISHHTQADPPFSVVYMGCDDLKAVNDTLGYDVGDQLLRTLGRALPNWLRVGDLVGRVGGDEFVAVLPGTDEAAARGVSERLLDHAVRLLSQHDWAISMSVGVTTFHGPPHSTGHALTLAHGAMTQAKRRGKRQVQVTSLAVSVSDPEQLPEAVLQQALREGLARHELFLQYQPIVPLGDEGESSVEALVRWRHPVFGVLPPSTFIPAAERSGLILPLGQEIVSLAMGQMRTWLNRGHAPRRVAINVSGVQLAAPGFARFVLQALQAARIPAERVEVELTEGVLIDGTATVMQALHSLVDAGVTLAIDDFGIGYSSLRTLRNLPVHALKIDRLFTEHIVDNPRDSSIVAAIIAMARTLGLRTVAEGIESEAQRDCLRGLGCGFGQGWLFGHPI